MLTLKDMQSEKHVKLSEVW